MANWDFFKWIVGTEKRVGIQILRESFSAPDASRDICQFCIRERKYHKRAEDHRFVEIMEK